MGECAAGSENRIGLNFSRNAGIDKLTSAVAALMILFAVVDVTVFLIVG